MEWSKFFTITAIILSGIGFLGTHRFNKEIQSLDGEETMPDEFVERWDKRMSFLIILSVLAMIIGIAGVLTR